MEFRRLLHALHGRHFGQDLGQQAALIEQFESAARAAFGEDARQLVAHPLGGHRADQRVIALDGRECRRLDGKSQARGEAHGAQQAQMIFAKPHRRVADGADHAAFQIGAPAYVVRAPRRCRDPSAGR